MSIVKNHLRIEHDLLGKVLYIKVKGGNAELHYQRHADSYIDFISTSVPEASRQFGVGATLVAAGLSFAQEQHLKVKASCEYVQQYLREHPETHHLLLEKTF